MIKSTIAKWLGHVQRRRIYSQADRAAYFQKKTLKYLLNQAENTSFGKDHGFVEVEEYADFVARVPLRDYEAGRPYFDRIVAGEADVSWPGKPLYLAKTSGTTSGAKYIPITSACIKKQIAAARDALLLYAAETGKADFFDGKMMFLSGSPEIEKNEAAMKIGRLSGIVNHFVPAALTANRVPSYEANIIEDWEDKVATIATEVHDLDLRLISGIPPWVQMFFEELEQTHGLSPLEAWPNLSLFVQGGVDFGPYKSIFDTYFKGKVDMLEVYPASEGFIAFQDSQKDNGLLLLINSGIFYEFIPIEEYGTENASRLPLWEVELDQQYAIILSTNAGLWAYDIGDTIKFTSLSPYKIRVTGRVKHFISAFGEHVISEEVNKAMISAAKICKADVQEFTVAPLIGEEQGEPYHEWWIEFNKLPADLTHFNKALDEELCKQNAYYNDLRSGNILRQAVIRLLKPDACRDYMKSIGKLGGQNKFPRLSNDRIMVDKLAAYEIIIDA